MNDMTPPSYTETVKTVNRRMERFEHKLDEVLITQREIEKSQAATTEHLRTLNSQVVKNVSAIAGQSRAIERNTTSLGHLSERSREHRIATDREHEEFVKLRISAKGEEVEQNEIKNVIDFARKNIISIILALSQGVVLYVLVEIAKRVMALAGT